MMKIAVILLFCSFAIHGQISDEEGVLVFTRENFYKGIEDNEFVLVEFYAPWCGHCKALAPEFVKAADTLASSGSSIKLAKVDATQETELAEQYEVRGYPTLKFFKKGEPIPYSGGRTAKEIVGWLNKKTGPPAKLLASVEEAKEFIDSNEVALLGFFEEEASDLAKAYLEVAATMDDYPFALISDNTVSNEYGVDDDSIIMFKKFDGGQVAYDGKASIEELKKFVQTESLPLVVEFNQDTAQKIFGGDIKNHLLMFLSKSAGHYDTIIDNAKAIAGPFRDRLLFVSINADEEDHQRILEFFGMKKEEVPSMRIIKLEEDMSKFKPADPELSTDNIKSFVTDFLDGKLKQHLLSQALPEDWDKNPVKVLVASNFEEVAFDKNKDVFVEFYAPWCGHCKQLVPIYEELAETFMGRDDVWITKIDATANELEHTKITSFPTLKLYTRGDNKVIDYNGERTHDAMAAFVGHGGVVDDAPNVPDEEEDEDDDLPKKDEL